MANPISPIFKEIDAALEQYYHNQNINNYHNNNNIGLFENYITSQELNHPKLPIEEELGDQCDPYNCTYTAIWMNTVRHFPIPPYVQLPYNTEEAFIFYILQYCYKYGQAPSDDYIQTVLVPKCNGTINNTLLLPNKNGNKPNVFMSQSTILVNCYLYGVCGGSGYFAMFTDIIKLIQLYAFGEEGTTYCIAAGDEDSDDSVAPADNGERLSAQSEYAILYYKTVTKNKKYFCMEMKHYYKASYGKIIKTFQELQKTYS